MAEDQPRCTICDVRVTFIHGTPVHYVAGRTELMRREPYPHEATTDPQ